MDSSQTSDAKQMRPPDLRRDTNSDKVIARFLLRLIILAAFATFGTQGFVPTLASLLALAAFYCVIAAAISREHALGPVLGHWDEAAAYTVVNGLLLRLL